MNGRPIRKPTYCMSNAPETLKALETRCLGQRGECSRRAGGQHVPCSGLTARRAAIFPMKLCRSILEGIRNQMAFDKRWSDGAVGVHCVEEDDHQDELLKVNEEMSGKHENYYDDITGQPLNPELV